MKRLMHARWASWTIRYVLLFSLVLWVMLFVLGWVKTRPESGPIIEGKSLYSWSGDLCDGSLIESANSPNRTRATNVIRHHYLEIMPTVLEWAHRKEPLSARVYFETLQYFLIKKSSYAYGEAAHAYRGAAARILGALGPIEARVLPTLYEIRDNSNNLGYEREVAQQSIERILNLKP